LGYKDRQVNKESKGQSAYKGLKAIQAFKARKEFLV
jgi:hypothetical protein